MSDLPIKVSDNLMLPVGFAMKSFGELHMTPMDYDALQEGLLPEITVIDMDKLAENFYRPMRVNVFPDPPPEREPLNIAFRRPW